MAFREVTMVEVKEILRQWLLGVSKRRIAKQLGFDIKTIRRYLAVARRHGLGQGQGLAGLTDDVVIAVAAVAQPSQGRPRGEGWAICETHRDVIKQYLDRGVRLTKVRKLLLRKGVAIEYPTLHRFAIAQLEFGRVPPTVPVADCAPALRCSSTRAG